MNSHLQEGEGAAKAVALLRVELDRCAREFDERRDRMDQMEGLIAKTADAIFVADPDEHGSPTTT